MNWGKDRKIGRKVRLDADFRLDRVGRQCAGPMRLDEGLAGGSWALFRPMPKEWRRRNISQHLTSHPGPRPMVDPVLETR